MWCTPTRAQQYIIVGWDGHAWNEDEWATQGMPAGMEAAVKTVLEKHGAVVRLFDQRGTAARGTARILLYPDCIEVPAVRIEDLPRRLLELAAAKLSTDGRPAPRALFVCIHGKRDACCAKFGYSLYRSLGEAVGSRSTPFEVFGTSHLGGDRFAPTLIAFPAGHMYGHLDSQEVGALLGAIEGGATYFPKYRGNVWAVGDEVFTDVATSAARWKFSDQLNTEPVVQRREQDLVEVTLLDASAPGSADTPVALVTFSRSLSPAYSSCRDARSSKPARFVTWNVRLDVL